MHSFPTNQKIANGILTTAMHKKEQSRFYFYKWLKACLKSKLDVICLRLLMIECALYYLDLSEIKRKI